MIIRNLQLYTVNLPFRFAFRHSLAERSCSHNVIVKATIENNSGDLFTGYGEGIPRDYVTGETIEQTEAIINKIYFPRFLGQQFSDSFELISFLKNEIQTLTKENRPVGAFWCALEIALLDAACKANGISLMELFGKQLNKQSSVKYGAVIPFSNKKALLGMLTFFKLYAFSTVKLKVGQDIEKDIYNIRLARLIMGDKATLRVDANCAWSVDETIAFADRVKIYNIASIEQPLPANNIEGLIQLTSCLPQTIVLDESLCTIEQAQIFADKKKTNNKMKIDFNIRLSKVGGFIAATAIRKIAQEAGIKCHLGAQVGESAILTAAARIFALIEGPFVNCEGAANMFLLRQDLTRENLTFSYGGLGKLPGKGSGLGITIEEKRILQLAEQNKMTANAIPVAKHASL
jgi:L-Ala-D/L-Glu epimerase